MQATWVHWLLVLFLCKSTGLAVALSVASGTDGSDVQGLAIQNPNSQCPVDTAVNGIHNITVGNLEPFQVSCDAKIAGPGWTVIARRTSEELLFYRNWDSFKRGFGNISGDFFIGLDKLHAITKAQNQELYVYLEDFEGNHRFAQYDEFYIESENEAYRMSKLGRFIGDAGDSLNVHRNQKFTTYDRDNDVKANLNCAVEYMGAWWHKDCHHSNLFGMYLNGSVDIYAKGMCWKGWRGYYYSYKLMQMMVRPK
ncbi:ficolin-1-like [Drosophila subobscura]|uniref:ficolin-1-like n=1 Tax=Drosophila subobscura TaxID=7241 RepID=UPI00155A1388|nr:ficolin-1-like [Drosophila subobscura]